MHLQQGIGFFRKQSTAHCLIESISDAMLNKALQIECRENVERERVNKEL